MHDESESPDSATSAGCLYRERMMLLRQLSAQVPDRARTLGYLLEVLGRHPRDIPFAVVYLPGAAGCSWTMAGKAGQLPEVLLRSSEEPEALLPVAQVASQGSPELVRLPGSGAGDSGQPCPEGEELLLAPILARQGGTLGVLGLGIDRSRSFDDDYRSFFELVAGQLGCALGTCGGPDLETLRHHAALEGINAILKGALTSGSERALGTVCLQIAQEVTRSSYGVIGELNGDGFLEISYLGPDGQACAMISTSERFCATDIYGKLLSLGNPVLDNAPQRHFPVHGMPEGHPVISCFLGVPLVSETKIIGMLAVANRPGGYTRGEQQVLEALAPAVVEAFQRKRAEQALQASEARLRQACRGANAAVWEWEPATGKVVWSPELWQVCGLEPGTHEPSYQAWLGSVLEEDRPGAEQAVREAVAQGGELCFEWRSLVCGRLRWFMSHASPQLSGQGGKVSYLGIVIDITDRKLVEEALRHSEGKFSTLFNKASLPAVLTRPPEYRFVDVNEAWGDLLGYSREDLIGKTSLEIGVIRNPERREEIVETLDRGANLRDCEQVLYTKSGKPLTVLTNVNTLMIDGEPYALTSIQDITARKRIEEELRSSEEKFSTMFEAAPIAISLATLPDGALHDVNAAWLGLAGFHSKDEVLGRTSLELGLLQDPQDRQRILDVYRRDGRVRNAETVSVSRDGVRRELLVSLDRVVISGVDYILTINEDITERKRVEEELRRHRDHLDALVKERTAALEARNAQLVVEATERLRVEKALAQSEQRYRAVVESQSDLITRYRPDGSYSFVNEAYCRFHGKSYQEVVGQNWHPDAVPEDLARIERRLRQLSPEHPSVSYECRVRSGAGKLHWMQVVNHGLFDAEGRLVESQAVGHDITELKETQQALKRYAQRLVQQDEELRQKVSMELHDDIGQELTALDFNLSYIGKNMSAESGRQLTGILEDSQVLTKEINRTVRNLMLDLRPSQLDVYGLAGAIQAYVHQYAKRSGLEVVLQIHPELPRMSPEKEVSLFRITQEALNNIGKYAHASKVTIALELERETVRLSIRDDGHGFQVGKTGPQPSGSGLGLTIMRERAEMVGGEFELTSQPGEGTTIQVRVGVEG
jgi:two-component system, NarL family, sensor histidine kinase UhpB